MFCTFLTLLIKLHLKRISRGALFFLRFVWWGYMMGFITLKQQNSWIINRELSIGDNNTSVFMSLVSLCSVSNSVNRCVIELPVQLPAVTGGRPGAWKSMISYVSALLNCNHKIRSSIRWMQYVVLQQTIRFLGISLFAIFKYGFLRTKIDLFTRGQKQKQSFQVFSLTIKVMYFMCSTCVSASVAV